MATNKLSKLWTNFTTDIISISVPLVAWETRVKEIFQLTPEDLTGATPVPATYRTYVNPVDLNDLGAAERDVEIGYMFMSYFGDVYSIIAVNDDGSIDISDILLCGYCPPSGRPAMIYSLIATIPTPKPPIVTTTRWIEEDLSCVLSGSDNTGIQIGTNRKQQYNTATSTWEYTGEEEPISRTNLSACPLPEPPTPDPYRAGQYTGMTFNPLGVTDFLFSFGSEVALNTIPLAGRNSLFLSIPVGKTFKVVDGSGVNITSKFSDISTTDNKTGYQNNKVWKKSPPYASEDAVPFYVTIS